MGLQLTIEKEKNQMYYDFIDAYWAIKEIRYTTEYLYSKLLCYPTRDASHHQGEKVSASFNVGGPYLPIVDSVLYQWEFATKIADVFPSGIPLDENEQKTAIYNWVKTYTGLPFKDVLEDEVSGGHNRLKHKDFGPLYNFKIAVLRKAA